jgi:acyl-CoA thioesterase
MTSITDILAAATPIEGGYRATITDNWLQGRTAYGGLSSALALHAAQKLGADLPPLRSAQVAFIGPLAGEVSVVATKLRRGRTAAFIQVDITSDAGLGFRATFVFMAPQTSRIDLNEAVATPHRPPTPDTELYVGPPQFFTGNFEFFEMKDSVEGAAWLRWTRLRERDGLDPFVELMTIGDALPPAAFRLFGKDPVPLSSLTWILNLLTPAPATRDGWWLLTATTDHARNGSSSQSMTIWNADGERVADAMQSVAIFG